VSGGGSRKGKIALRAARKFSLKVVFFKKVRNLRTLVCDAENRVTSATNGGASGTYTYDGNGLRVEKVSGSTTTVTIFSGGQDIAEYVNGAAPSSPTNEYIYWGSQQIASIQSGVIHYLHSDQLSLRMRTDSSGNVADQRGTYPFGETWYSPTGAPWMFTSYYRDTESGNDYAMARFYSNPTARFTSPDPLAGSIANPQSLNRYAYVLSDPLNLIDPLGLDCYPVTFPDGSMGFQCDVSAPFPPDLLGGGGIPHISPLQDVPDFPGPPNFGPGGGGADALLNAILASRPEPPPPPGYENCITGALEEVIHAGETPNQPNEGYGTLVQGTVVGAPPAFQAAIGAQGVIIANPQELPGFPHFLVHVSGGVYSSAFGRYQMNAATWAQFGNGSSISPSAQDDAAAAMLQYYDAVAPAMQGNLQQAFWNMFQWARMPDSPYGQRQISMQEAMDAFNSALTYLPECQ
jgi:RHS repeat-associated protein